MKLDINLVRHTGNNCFKDIIATVASYWNINYQMTFSYSWNFSFQSSTQLIGNGILHFNENDGELLNKYRGIKVTKFDINEPEILKKYISDELANNSSVAIEIPILGIPWANDYKKKGAVGTNAILIIGVDNYNNYICVDTLKRI